MGLFGAAHGWGDQKAPTPPHSLPKICHAYPTMIERGTVKPYLKKIQKLYKSRGTLLDFCRHRHFFTGNQQLLFKKYQEIQI